MRRSFEDWIDAECAVGPLLIVLEDLHWGDSASIAYLDGVLRKLSDRPLLVLALARPEVHDLFPKLWSGTHEIRLGGLTRRASERLVHAVLGDELAPEKVRRIVDRADGNAYYLEELIRRVAEDGSEELPETILAMVQSRLDRLEPDARRIVRAASVFGEVFWEGGVVELVGGAHGSEVVGWLRTLVDRELVAARSSEKFLGETEYTFRHGLLRDAAYAMLTDADRPTAHRLAGEWLARAGEKDALVLADHFERGGELAQTIPWLLAAAKSAFDGCQWEATLALGERAIRHGAGGDVLGAVRRLQTSAAGAVGDMALMSERAHSAMQNLPRGSGLWARAAGGGLFAQIMLGAHDSAIEIAKTLLVEPRLEPTGHTLFGLQQAIVGLGFLGRGDIAFDMFQQVEAVELAIAADDLRARAWARVARLVAWYFAGAGSCAHAVAGAQPAVDDFETVGDPNGPSHATSVLGALLSEAGDPRSRAMLDTAIAIGERVRHRFYIETPTFWRARDLTFRGRFDEAAKLAATLGPPFRDAALGIAACAHLAHGLLDEAESAAHDARNRSFGAYFEGVPIAVLAQVALARGQPAEAVRLADVGITASKHIEHLNETSLLRLARVDALRALGNADAARAATLEARDRILRIASAIDDPQLRASYQTNVDANARTLALAAKLT